MRPFMNMVYTHCLRMATNFEHTIVLKYPQHTGFIAIQKRPPKARKIITFFTIYPIDVKILFQFHQIFDATL